MGETLVFSFSNNLGKTQYEHLCCNIPFFLLLYNNNNNNLTIIILSLFTLGSIYSTYASGAEKMTETKSLNQTINRFKNPATGRRQTSWLFTSLVEDLNSGRLWRSASGQNSGNPRPPNCKSGVLTAWPRCPLPFSSLCVHFFLSFSYTVVIVALVRPRTFRRFASICSLTTDCKCLVARFWQIQAVISFRKIVGIKSIGRFWTWTRSFGPLWPIEGKL